MLYCLSVAERPSFCGIAAENNSGTTGDFTWSFDRESGTLTIGTDNVPEDRYAVFNTRCYSSDQVIFEGESQQFFIMPDEDVTIDVTFETAKQLNGVADFNNDGKVDVRDVTEIQRILAGLDS